jgi:hypothetical protein
VWEQIDAEDLSGKSKAQHPHRDRIAARTHIPEVREPMQSVDKKLEIPVALSMCPYFVRADCHENSPDSGLTTRPEPRTKQQAQGLMDEKAPTVPNEKPSWAQGSLTRGSKLETNSHGHCGNPWIRGCLDSESLTSNRARRLGCPALYPAWKQVWNPVANLEVPPVAHPDDCWIDRLALAHLLLRRYEKLLAPERFGPDLTPAGVSEHREGLFGIGQMKPSPDRQHPCGARHHATRQSTPY